MINTNKIFNTYDHQQYVFHSTPSYECHSVLEEIWHKFDITEILIEA